MTTDHSGRILAILNAGFPRDAIEAPTAELWVIELGALASYEAAHDAALRIVRAGDTFPSLREFRLAYGQAVDRRSAGRELEAIDEAVPPTEDVRAWAAERGIATLRDVD